MVTGSRNLSFPYSFSGQDSYSSSSQEHPEWLQEILREPGLRSPRKTRIYLQLISTLPSPADSSDKWSREEATTGSDWGPPGARNQQGPQRTHWSDPCPDWLCGHREPPLRRHAGELGSRVQGKLPFPISLFSCTSIPKIALPPYLKYRLHYSIPLLSFSHGTYPS